MREVIFSVFPDFTRFACLTDASLSPQNPRPWNPCHRRQSWKLGHHPLDPREKTFSPLSSSRKPFFRRSSTTKEDS